MTTWLAVALVGGGCFLFRSVPLFAAWAAEPSARVQRLVNDAGLAAIAALLAGSLRHQVDAAGVALGAVALLAVATTAVVSVRRPFHVAIAAGLAAYLVATTVVGAA